MTPPFSTLNTVLKYMRTDDQDGVARQAMAFAFAEFFAEEKANEQGIETVKQLLDDGPRITDAPRACSRIASAC